MEESEITERQETTIPLSRLEHYLIECAIENLNNSGWLKEKLAGFFGEDISESTIDTALGHLSEEWSDSWPF